MFGCLDFRGHRPALIKHATRNYHQVSPLFFYFQQIEHTSRLDFIWKEKFKVERDEVETMGSLNKILLENILPAHVADHFLKSGKRFSEVTDQVLSFIILF